MCGQCDKRDEISRNEFYRGAREGFIASLGDSGRNKKTADITKIFQEEGNVYGHGFTSTYDPVIDRDQQKLDKVLYELKFKSEEPIKFKIETPKWLKDMGLGK